MQEINAFIINKKSRKFWYVKYQMLFENETVKKEESTKVLKTEKNLKYMQTKYLPAWIAQKLNDTEVLGQHNILFSRYASIYLSECESLHDYNNIEYRTNRILLDFSQFEIQIITKLQIRQWINQLIDKRSKEELSKRSKVKYLSIFRGIFKQAVDDNILERNIINDIQVTGRKSTGEEIKPFFKNEVSILLSKSKNLIYGNDMNEYLGIAFNQGMSPAEIIGLQVNDVDTVDQIISIKRNITKGTTKETKNIHRRRTIPMFDTSVPYIISLLKKAKQKKSIWLFSNNNGTQLYDIGSIRGSRQIIKDNKRLKSNTKWYKLLVDCNIDYRDLKNCRHTFAVTAIESKAFSMQEVADMLGHNSLKMLIEHYAKWIKGKGLNANTKIDLFNSQNVDNLVGTSILVT